MALYVPEARRRRRVLLTATATGVVGLVIGAAAGRISAPTVAERVAATRTDARDTASSLRVISLHTSAAAVGAGGIDHVLGQVGAELDGEFERAPWVAGVIRQDLQAELDALRARPDRDGAGFGDAADSLATHIEEAFNGVLRARPTSAPEPEPSAGPTAQPSPSTSADPSGTPSAAPS